MFEIGRVCIKIAGRDAGLKCAVVDVIDSHTVLVEGQTRRRKCNVKHLEPLDQVLSITKGAPSSVVAKEFGMSAPVKKEKMENKALAPKKIRIAKPKRVPESKVPSKARNRMPDAKDKLTRENN